MVLWFTIQMSKRMKVSHSKRREFLMKTKFLCYLIPIPQNPIDKTILGGRYRDFGDLFLICFGNYVQHYALNRLVFDNFFTQFDTI